MTRVAAFLLAATAAAVLAAAAQAGTPPKQPGGSSSAVPQYVEQVPTSGGSKAPGVGTAKAKALPPKVKAKLQSQGGSDSAALQTLVTSPDYGAPAAPRETQRVRTTTVKKQAKPANAVATRSASVAPVSSNGGSSELVWLVALLAGIALVAAGAFAFKRYAR